MSRIRFRFSWKVTIICCLLAAGMVRASFWQWDRHQKKQLYVEKLLHNLEQPIVDFNELGSISNEHVSQYIFRRVKVSGEFDYNYEMILRNRRYEDSPGVFVLTPFKIANHDKYTLVSRGFLPLSHSTPEDRKKFQKIKSQSFTAIIKEGASKRFLAPADPPTGQGMPWVDGWLRVDINNISKQLPYSLMPFYLEIMPEENVNAASKRILTSSSGREDIFNLTSRIEGIKQITVADENVYPIPVFDTVIPPARHLGYVYEWAIMAFMTLCIGLVLQLRRPKVAS